jgi:xylose dehydrogenase (NAD/NADP)
MMKINWGILGCAGIAEKAFIPAIQESGNGILYGIASRDSKRAWDWALGFGFRKSYHNYQALLEDREIDAIYVPLPNNLHAEWAARAAEAGKHVLCEKPMALNAEEVRQMAKAAKKAGVLLMEGFMYRFHPQIERALEIIRAKEIGEVRTVHSSFTFNRAFGDTNYRLSPEMGGGALYDVGCYTISLARLVFGEEPQSVFARARMDPRTGVDLTGSALLEFTRGRAAHCDWSFESHFQSRLLAVGSEGSVVLDRAFSGKDSDVEVRIAKGDRTITDRIPRVNMFARMIEHFGDCIFKRTPLRYPPEDAEKNMRAIDACFKSLKTGHPAQVLR